MAYFKNYTFEYNAQRVDVFKSIVVCSSQLENDSFTEGNELNIDVASFYGVITNCKNAGEKFTLEVTAESWGRELRNTAVTEESEFRQVDAIRLLRDHILPSSWELIYPASFDTEPRFISYILRNGAILSHINTVMDALGLDFTIYSEMTSGTLKKYVKSYFRDDFTGRDISSIVERKDIAGLSVTVDYGKVATSITIMGAESEQGINQTFMDAEISDWGNAPRAVEVRDTTMKKPEMSASSLYFWYYPASETDYTIDQLKASDTVLIDNERMKINAMYFLPALWLASFEKGDIGDDDLPKYLQPLSSYVASGVIVASIIPASFEEYIYSVRQNVEFPTGRGISNYGTAAEVHAIYDGIFATEIKISTSPYLTYGKNLPQETGFIWIGSERIFYRTATYDELSGTYTLTGLVRGVPTCANKDCEHRGSFFRPVGYARGCPLVGGTDGTIDDICPLAEEVAAALDVDSISECPLVFDQESVCPLLKCPKLNDFSFTSDIETIYGTEINMCPKALARSDIIYTSAYQHHKRAIVFPASYYYSTSATGHSEDTYEIYARDSLIAKYGYLPTRVQTKGIADQDGLDKIAEGRLRLSALPLVGTFTLLQYDPWVIPANMFPGDVIRIKTASHGRYDFEAQCWYPTYWFDVSSKDPENTVSWINVSSPGADRWVKYQGEFVIQKITKSQRGMPQITFGAGAIDYQDITDYITDTLDTTSQRHRNQDPSKVIATSETGIAAQVRNIKTGATTWVRMVK